MERNPSRKQMRHLGAAAVGLLALTILPHGCPEEGQDIPTDAPAFQPENDQSKTTEDTAYLPALESQSAQPQAVDEERANRAATIEEAIVIENGEDLPPEMVEQATLELEQHKSLAEIVNASGLKVQKSFPFSSPMGTVNMFEVTSDYFDDGKLNAIYIEPKDEWQGLLLYNCSPECEMLMVTGNTEEDALRAIGDIVSSGDF